MNNFGGAIDHTIKHFALHRIGGLEWRIISDIESGVIAITEVEEEVLTRFVALPQWPHSVVSFFVLQDLGALQRQLEARLQRSDGSAAIEHSALPAGGIAALAHRPVVNLYDLADPQTCNVFVNQMAMKEAGYWGDRLAEAALLAHEHAHPLVENATIGATRRTALHLKAGSRIPVSRSNTDVWMERIGGIITNLAERLCLYAPREVFTNDLVIRAGLSDALCYLDRITIERSLQAIQGRQALAAGLRAEPSLTDAGRLILMLLADFQAHLEMSFELASFRRERAESCVRELDALLRKRLFPNLAPAVGQAFSSLSKRYVQLTPNLTGDQFVRFAQSILAILAEVLAASGITLDGSPSVI